MQQKIGSDLKQIIRQLLSVAEYQMRKAPNSFKTLVMESKSQKWGKFVQEVIAEKTAQILQV